MPRGDKSKYTGKQERKAEHIEQSYESRGVSEKEAERRAWATVNKDDGGGKRAGGSGRGKSTGHPAAHKGGRIGGPRRRRDRRPVDRRLRKRQRLLVSETPRTRPARVEKTMARRERPSRERAYFLWLVGGCREGQAERHWLAAETLIEGDAPERAPIEGEPAEGPARESAEAPRSRRERRRSHVAPGEFCALQVAAKSLDRQNST